MGLYQISGTGTRTVVDYIISGTLADCVILVGLVLGQ